MTVIRPNSISGINSITGNGGDISIFRADGTAGDVTVNNITSGVITATTFSGNITGNLSGGTINATSGTVTGNLGVGGVLTYEDVTNIDSIGIITARAGINVSGGTITGDGSGLTGVGLGTDGSANTSGIITATAFVPTTGQLSHRNLIINGAMTVSQRGTSDSSINGYGTVDRFGLIRSGVDENPVQTQHTLTSSDTGPYAEGFRKSFHVQNGNQTGGVGGNDYISMRYRVEAQDMANSGWNYTSSSSFITLSFWVKSSVAQNFYGYFYSHDGTAQGYSFETGSLTADTWTKVVLKIPGNSNLSFDNDTNEGFDIYISQFWGINRTDPGKNLNSWAAYNGAARIPDFASTWYTTNNATFEITGVQLEVGDTATSFEHRSYGEEFSRCQRYFKRMRGAVGGGGGYGSAGDGAVCTMANWTSTGAYGLLPLGVEMRYAPKLTGFANLNYFSAGNTFAPNGSSQCYLAGSSYDRVELTLQSMTSMAQGNAGWLRIDNTNGYMDFDAEI